MQKKQKNKIKVSKKIKKSFKVANNVLENSLQISNIALGGWSKGDKIKSILSDRPVTNRLVPLMMQTLGSSTHSLQILSKKPSLQSRDCFSICRSIVELSINICYILAEGEPGAEQAERHAKQKAYRKLSQSSDIGGQSIKVEITNFDKIEKSEELEESIDEFTSKRGRPKNWTDKSLSERLA